MEATVYRAEANLRANPSTCADMPAAMAPCGHMPDVGLDECTQLPCNGTSSCCRVPLLPLLRRQSPDGSMANNSRLDIIVKALVADAWLRGNETSVHERAYSRYLDVRLADPGNPSSVRLAMFRGLYDSVQALGRFDWEHTPVMVDRDLTVVDGAHRLALALVMSQRRVGLRRECSAPRWHRAAPPRPQTLDFVRHALGAASHATQLVSERASELFASGTWRGLAV